jgi:hypothetical protein
MAYALRFFAKQAEHILEFSPLAYSKGIALSSLQGSEYPSVLGFHFLLFFPALHAAHLKRYIWKGKCEEKNEKKKENNKKKSIPFQWR